MEIEALLTWSRAQFALTACYHWLFVPLTLGLGIIMSLAETKYYRTRKPEWKHWAQFWQKLFGINFAIGVATGIILEFEFGTNWSNYSWLVGDIFGAPLAIEGILAFFMEATFIAVMFFGWNKVTPRFHLASTWLTVIGATISAVWILIANSWMQDPQGVVFNPATVRSEMTDFWAVALSSTAINKFWHTVTSSWLLGSIFALAICAYYMLRKDKKHHEFALANARIIAPFGLIAALLTAFTGDTSAVNVAERQPMKLAAMEGLYDGGMNTPEGKSLEGGASLSLFGIPKSGIPAPGEEAFYFNIKVPKMLSLMATHTPDGYVPGINNLLDGGYYLPDGSIALSAEEKMERGRTALAALTQYHEAMKAGNQSEMDAQNKIIQENFPYFGYGHINDRSELIPNVPINYYSFRIMVGCGLLFILVLLIATIFARKPEKYRKMRWFHILTIVCLPLVYLASQSGWIVAELGRQPWTIQDILPVRAAVSSIEASSVMITFALFALLFTVLLVAEINIMVKSVKEGPAQQSTSSEETNK